MGSSETAYAGRKAAVVLMAGCPWKCGYCNVPLLASGKCYAEEPANFFVDFMRKNKDDLEAVVFSGGEPLMQGNALAEACKGISEQGFKVKIETNGFYPDSLRDVLPFLSCVAMDLKTRLEADDYAKAAGNPVPSRVIFSQVLRSIAFLKRAKLYKEFSTTVVPGVNDYPDFIIDMVQQVPFADAFVLQQFEPSEALVDPSFGQLPRPSRETLLKLAAVAKHFVSKAVVRADGEEVEVR
ncbi:TPA: radical SAM protein [Candidatus Micrarchaeota archaeon]|nr:MAG: hypothetical protein AUJ65_04405 [Candidatus Micrarchaeota archaeon CG1_02_51_15]HII38844.1 radical SAM protein [Candidatus Micrarchaeota archaeon]